MYASARMTHARLMDGVFALANLAMAVYFGWSLVAGDDAVPGAVIVAAGIGGFLILGETVWYVIRRRRDPDREFR
jgi:hypothetical protein